MASKEELRQTRLAKLQKIKDAGMNPYPVATKRSHTMREASEGFQTLAEAKEKITLAGRVMGVRAQGALIFFNINDGEGIFQGLLKKDEMDAALFDLFSEAVDVGDFVEATGTLFTTKRGEKTLAVTTWTMLTKSLLPLPEKWHGLQDIEERFRHRYLDTLMNEEVRKRFIQRSQIVSEIRRALDKEGFLEVETPILQPLAGGASAEPFKTHHNALDMDLYMRIAPELYLKELLVGGFSKVYEIGRSFRNEGIDTTHNPEFTTVEWYESYSDAKKQRNFVEKVLKSIVKKVTGQSSFIFDGQKIDFSKKFAVVSYFELLQRQALISHPEKISRDELSLKASQLGATVEPTDGIPKIMDSIYKKVCRPKLIQPTFIVDYPVDYLPLAKKNEKDPSIVDAFQVVVGGVEIVKAFSELNDPIDQRERFLTQAKLALEGDKEAQPSDEAFIEALEYGMPPAGGLAISIDRMTMLLSNVKNIREVIFFPTLRPRK